MKYFYFPLLFIVTLLSCNKNNSTSGTSTLQLLQQKWKVDSVFINFSGNIYHDIRDSVYQFDNSGFLIRTRYSQFTAFPLYDTMKYILQNDNNTLIFQSLPNGITPPASDTAKILSISGSSLIYKIINSWTVVLSR